MPGTAESSEVCMLDVFSGMSAVLHRSKVESLQVAVMEKLERFTERDEEFCRLHRVGRICKQVLSMAAPGQYLYLTRQELNEIKMAMKSIPSVICHS
ncbi:hypothetical protein BI343_02280 [Chromobacterium amazonense]|uniref:Uncharacterized protein n=2 Tax=Chromobacterium amazonense TaxID=1382803 RepID=A0A1S1X6T5_9NEIS|nr:hypothetical protein BI343_02280 [Chromobacterium amazonense]PRP71474.1 hypothetical protein BUE93_06630 [Chromobacterium amazonense]